MTNDQTVTQALKPCPFCGGEAAFKSGFTDGRDVGRVHCTQCGATEYPFVRPKAETIAAWNTRTAHSGEAKKCGGALGSSGMVCALPEGHDGICAAKAQDDSGHGYCGAPPPHSGEGRSNGAGEDAVIQGLWLDILEKDDRTSPEEYPDMALIAEDEFAESIRYALAALSAPQGEMERLGEAALTDNPDWICAGIPDHAIEAGIEQWDAINDAMVARNLAKHPEDLPDWDSGMIVAAIFKAVARSILAQPEAADEITALRERVGVLEEALKRTAGHLSRQHAAAPGHADNAAAVWSTVAQANAILAKQEASHEG